jgi:hypothetical protein
MKALHQLQLTSRRDGVVGKSCLAWGMEPASANVTGSSENPMR